MPVLIASIDSECARPTSHLETEKVVKALKSKLAERAAEQFKKALLADKNSDLWFINSEQDSTILRIKLEYTVEV